MKDPTRLLDLHPSAAGAEPDAGLSLLRAAAVEEPPAGAVERLLGVLNAGGPAADGGGPTLGDAHLSGVRPATRAVGGASGSAVKLGLPWIALGSAGVVALAVSAWLATRPVTPTPSAASPGPAPVASHQVQVPQPSAASSSAPPAASAALPVDPLSRADDRGAGTTPATSSRSGALAQEIASLDRVRGLLTAGNPARALSALRRHARTYADGALQQESTVLQIEALIGTGNSQKARALAARFLADHRDSPHAQRVQALAAEAESDAPR